MKRIVLSLLFIILLPVAAWAVYKPVRVLEPGWVTGISCVDETLCLEDLSMRARAAALYAGAEQHVAAQVGQFHGPPRVTFCSTQACYQRFGFDRSSASTLGGFGIVVGPRGWAPHLLRHEMIHYRQAEELGAFAAWTSPEWLIEGMAYSLSDDPRKALAPALQRDREQFDAWLGETGREKMWSEADKL